MTVSAAGQPGEHGPVTASERALLREAMRFVDSLSWEDIEKARWARKTSRGSASFIAISNARLVELVDRVRYCRGSGDAE